MPLKQVLGAGPRAGVSGKAVGKSSLGQRLLHTHSARSFLYYRGRGAFNKALISSIRVALNCSIPVDTYDLLIEDRGRSKVSVH